MNKKKPEPLHKRIYASLNRKAEYIPKPIGTSVSITVESPDGSYMADYDLKVEYTIAPKDPSVGIMSEYIDDLAVVGGIELQNEAHGGNRELTPEELKNIEDLHQDAIIEQLAERKYAAQDDSGPEREDYPNIYGER